MGSRNWPAELARRCRAVDWEAEIVSNGHYKVRTHEGKVFSFSVSPSDRHAEKNAIRQARHHGLERREQMYALQREADRLRRIQADRESAENTISAINDQTKEEDMKKPKEPQPDLGDVDGTPIVAVAPATLVTPRTKGNAVPLADGEEILLADDRVLYRCTKEVNGKPCHRTFTSAQGVASHKWRHDMPGGAPAAKPEPVPSGAGTAPTKAQPEPGIIAQLERLINDFEAFADDLGAVCDVADRIKVTLHELVQALPQHVADNATVEKARMYDQLRSMLK